MKRFLLTLALSAVAALSALQMQGRDLKPLAFYLKNLPCRRCGSMSDDEIHSDLRAKGFIVIDVDCSSFPSSSPGLEESLVGFHKTCKTVYSAYETDDTAININRILYVPEGYTITPDIPVWNIMEHGDSGAVQRVMGAWNKSVAVNGRAEPLPVREDGTFDPADACLMHNPDGSPIDWWLRIDIIHPSGKSGPVPLVLNFATNGFRFGNTSPAAAKEYLWRNVLYFAFLTSGYALANADHCYYPVSRNDTWGHLGYYSLDDSNGMAANRAYIRYLNAHKENYNLNGKIGVMGISKASQAAVRIADPDNAERQEYSRFKYSRPARQPWPGYDSKVDVAYAAAGAGTTRIAKFLTRDYVPMITSAGKKDQFNKWNEYPSVIRALEEKDLIHLDFWMEDLGHTYPCLGRDTATGEMRHVLFKRFFDHYLNPSDDTAADVFYILPQEGACTDTRGYSRILPPDDMLPADMDGIAKYSPICVRFLEPCSISEIEHMVRVTAVNGGKRVRGKWLVSMRGTCFTFIPDKDLESGLKYKISVPAGLTNLAGLHPSETVEREFVAGSLNKP